MTVLVQTRATANGVARHYVTAGSGPVVSSLRSWGRTTVNFSR